MRRLVLLILTLLPALGRADLLAQVNLENAIQDKLSTLAKIYDEGAKVLVHLEVKTYEGSMPGSNALNIQHIAPDKIEPIDIGKITVKVFLRQKPPAVLRELLLNALPIKDSHQVSLSFEILSPESGFAKVEPKPVEVKPIEIHDLSQIMSSSINNLSRNIAALVILSLMALTLALHVQNSRLQKDFRLQFKALSEAVANSTGSALLPPMANAARGVSEPSNEPVDSTPFEHWTTAGLKELFADVYWCELDGYAHWLWKNLSGRQRTELLQALPYMKQYCDYFVEMEAIAHPFHEHPYYLEPLTLAQVSQDDLGDLVKKEPALWKSLSPMRRQRLALSLSEKIAAIQSVSSAKPPDLRTLKSPLRALKAVSVWGEVSQQDEKTIFQDPSVVPSEIRQHVRSIVWLAKKDREFIRRTLEKFDARSLASAWVGPEDVLRALEIHLPEKKLKLVHNYRSRVAPSRSSEIYQFLVEEGLKDEAA